MLAAIFAAVTTLQKVLFCKDNVAFLRIVKILRVKVWSSEIIVHITHVCKVNKNRAEGLWLNWFPLPLR